MIIKYILKPLKNLAKGTRALQKRFFNELYLLFFKRRSNIRVHLGCGDEKLPGFINVDWRLTQATDYIIDLNNPWCFGDDSVECFYSNAFFEHLYRNQRLPHLKRIVRALKPDVGFCCYIGLPYFPNIAKLYLKRGPGVVGKTFDLYNVYRYTHGDPEHRPDYWLMQLHKSLFDEEELTSLLYEAGLTSCQLFIYCFVGEEERPINMGFYATKSQFDKSQLRSDCLQFINEVAANKVILDTIRFMD